MKFGWSLALAALFVAGTAFAQDTTSEKGKLSYAIGFQIGSGLADRKMDVDIATVTKAIQDAFAKKPPEGMSRQRFALGDARVVGSDAEIAQLVER